MDASRVLPYSRGVPGIVGWGIGGKGGGLHIARTHALLGGYASAWRGFKQASACVAPA